MLSLSAVVCDGVLLAGATRQSSGDWHRQGRHVRCIRGPRYPLHSLLVVACLMAAFLAAFSRHTQQYISLKDDEVVSVKLGGNLDVSRIETAPTEVMELRCAHRCVVH